MGLTDAGGRRARTRFRAFGGTRTTIPSGEMVAPGEPASLTSESFTGPDAMAAAWCPTSNRGLPRTPPPRPPRSGNEHRGRYRPGPHQRRANRGGGPRHLRPAHWRSTPRGEPCAPSTASPSPSRAGETLGLVGESGSGKTMTGMSVMRLLPPGGLVAGGSIAFDGRDLTALASDELRRLRGNDIAMVFQDPMTSLNPTRTIGSQLREAYRIHRRSAPARRPPHGPTRCSASCGCPVRSDRLRDYPHQLSGGMRQRAMIAMALSERAAAADRRRADDRAGRLHPGADPRPARRPEGPPAAWRSCCHARPGRDRRPRRPGRRSCTRGRIVEEAPTTTAFRRPPAPLHRRRCSSRCPPLELDSRHALASIPGVPPQLIDLPPSAASPPRCRFAARDCRTQDPELRHRGAGAHRTPASTRLDRPRRRPDRAVTVAQRRARSTRDRRGRGAAGLDSTPWRSFHVTSPALLRAAPGACTRSPGSRSTVLAGRDARHRRRVRLRQDHDRPDVGRPRAADQPAPSPSTGTTRPPEPVASARKRRRDLQMMFQDSSAALDPRMRVCRPDR